MAALVFAVAVAVLAFGAGLFGLRLHARLPEEHAPERAREMIGAMAGMLSLLLALVLGTLIGQAYSLYATQRAEVETLAARALQLDAALEAFGPEAQPGREGLHKAIVQIYDKIWVEGGTDAMSIDLKSIVAGGKVLNQFLMSLEPKTDGQKQALAVATAAAGQIEQTRIMMQLQLLGGISLPMLAIVVAWSLLLFCGYGLVSQANRLSVTALALGAVAVASAILMIIELSRPFTGLFKLPAAPIVQTIQALGS